MIWQKFKDWLNAWIFIHNHSITSNCLICLADISKFTINKTVLKNLFFCCEKNKWLLVFLCCLHITFSYIPQWGITAQWCYIEGFLIRCCHAMQLFIWFSHPMHESRKIFQFGWGGGGCWISGYMSLPEGGRLPRTNFWKFYNEI